MATQRKKWPHEVEWARLDCIALAQVGRQALIAILEQTHDARTLRAITKACESFREIEAKMNEAKENNHE